MPSGGAGSYARLTDAVFRVFAGNLRESASLALGSVANAGRFTAVACALPLMALVPLATLLSYVHETWGGRVNHASYLSSRSPVPARRRSVLGPRLIFGSES